LQLPLLIFIEIPDRRQFMIRVMFLCTGNSCRSQMAEGFARVLGKGLIDAHSAGLTPTDVNEQAIAVMQEIGIDISDQESKEIDADFLLSMDVIITLCGNAEASCPMTPPHIKRIHWPIDDPATVKGSEEEIMDEFRKTRDEIRNRIRNFIEFLISSS
jgi:arsenate reductase